MNSVIHRLVNVPKNIRLGFIIMLLITIAWSQVRIAPHAYTKDLPEPIDPVYLRFAGLGDDIFLSKILILWLQGYDYQSNISISYRNIDYEKLIKWLDVSMMLNPESQYPLLLASRVYGEVNDPGRQRKILKFIAGKFIEKPEERWRWMAHAVYIAKYRLNDLELALRLARILANNVSTDSVPFWASQMHIYILEDMGDIEAAKILLGGLIDSGEIKDPNELEFLMNRLGELERHHR